MSRDLIKVCYAGKWQHAYLVACGYDFVTVRLMNGQYACIDNDSWGLLF